MQVTRKGLTLGCVIILIGLTVSTTPASLHEQPSTEGSWLYVGGGGLGNYSKIQDAIDNATNGDTIFVYPGSYQENLVINKSIVLCGQEQQTTVILGVEQADTVFINKSNVEFFGFTIQSASGTNEIGIMLLECVSSHVYQNTIKSCYYGILVAESESLMITNNTILNCTFGIENVITGNLTIINNSIDGNGKGVGIEVQATMFRNHIRRNSLTHNAIGINLIYTSWSDIQENNFIDNHRDAFFISSFFNKWQQNYWSQPHLLPKLIVGQIGGMLLQRKVPWFNMDWHPAKEPFDIPKT